MMSKTFGKLIRLGLVGFLAGLIFSGFYPFTVKAATINYPTNNLGLAGYWTFDGTDMISNVRDRSGQDSHGNLSGQTSTTTVVGKIGQAITFDGVDDYVSVANESNFDFTHTQPFSLAAWVNINPAFSGKENDIIVKADPSTFKGYSLYITDTRFITFFIQQSSGSNFISTRAETAGLAAPSQWTHIVATYDGSVTEGGLKIYVNGQAVSLVSSSAGTVNDILNNENLLIGDDVEADTCCNFGGKIDDARIYNRGSG
jgi:hypothetical protein